MNDIIFRHLYMVSRVNDIVTSWAKIKPAERNC